MKCTIGIFEIKDCMIEISSTFNNVIEGTLTWIGKGRGRKVAEYCWEKRLYTRILIMITIHIKRKLQYNYFENFTIGIAHKRQKIQYNNKRFSYFVFLLQKRGLFVSSTRFVESLFARFLKAIWNSCTTSVFENFL